MPLLTWIDTIYLDFRNPNIYPEQKLFSTSMETTININLENMQIICANCFLGSCKSANKCQQRRYLVFIADKGETCAKLQRENIKMNSKCNAGQTCDKIYWNLLVNECYFRVWFYWVVLNSWSWCLPVDFSHKTISLCRSCHAPAISNGPRQ